MNGHTYVSWVRADVQFGGESETICIFDNNGFTTNVAAPGGGNCSELNLCDAGYAYFSRFGSNSMNASTNEFGQTEKDCTSFTKTGEDTIVINDSCIKPILLIIDEDTIDNGIQSIENISFGAPSCGGGDPSVCVNDDIANPGVRQLLFTNGNNITPFSGLVLPTGEAGDEGLFMFTNPNPQMSQDGGAPFSIQDFIFATGAAADENNLDKIDGVVPLGAADIAALNEQTVCAVVYDSDVSTDVKDGYASLKGATTGLTAFTVTAVGADPDGSDGSVLPSITVDLLPSAEVVATCERVLPPE